MRQKEAKRKRSRQKQGRAMDRRPSLSLALAPPRPLLLFSRSFSPLTFRRDRPEAEDHGLNPRIEDGELGSLHR